MYGDAAGFTAYFEQRAIAIPGTWDDELIEAALLVASEWLDGVFGPSFIGYKTGGHTQEREWPRTSATVVRSTPWYTYPTSEIPEKVKRATYEAAFRHATTPGSLQKDFTPSKFKSVRVEGAISVDYMAFTQPSEIQMQIGIIDTLLWPLLESNGGAGSSSYSGGSMRV